MKKEVSEFAIHQTAKTLALIFFVIAVVVGVLYGLSLLSMGWEVFMQSIWMIVLAVIAYPLFVYIYFAILLALYNFVARRAGGITFTLSDKS